MVVVKTGEDKLNQTLMTLHLEPCQSIRSFESLCQLTMRLGKKTD